MENLIHELKEYGDTLSTTSVPISVLNERLIFLKRFGTKEDPIKRGRLIKRICKYDKDIVYEKILLMPLNELEITFKVVKEKHDRKLLTYFLLNNGYSIHKINATKMYKLKEIKRNIIKNRGTKKELIDIMCKHNIWKEKKSLETWGIERLKNNYKKWLFAKYDPVNGSSKYERELVRDLCDVLWIDIAYNGMDDINKVSEEPKQEDDKNLCK